ncbi:hypothetical protein, partial [Escherichia coli]|uniref:hypothetical protein n=1 Tax=Escherichia coli TaxID=562 RepID=UPI003D05623D
RGLVVTPNAHPSFSVMRTATGTAYVRDGELDRLRAAEERSRQAARKRDLAEGKISVEPYRPGDEVKLSCGAFAGLSG